MAQSCLTLCDPMDSSLQGSTIYGIFQARILEWAAISFSRGSSQPRDHLTPVRMTIMKKSKKNRCWRRCGEKGILFYCWWKCKLVQPLWRTVWRFLKKLGIELSYDPEILLLDIHCKETKTERDTYTLMFIEVLFAIARTWK